MIKATLDFHRKNSTHKKFRPFFISTVLYTATEQMKSTREHCLHLSGLSYSSFTLKQMLVVVYASASSKM